MKLSLESSPGDAQGHPVATQENEGSRATRFSRRTKFDTRKHYLLESTVVARLGLLKLFRHERGGPNNTSSMARMLLIAALGALAKAQEVQMEARRGVQQPILSITKSERRAAAAAPTPPAAHPGPLPGRLGAAPRPPAGPPPTHTIIRKNLRGSVRPNGHAAPTHK